MAKTIQRFNRRGSTQNRPRHGRPKKLSVHAQCNIQRLCLGNRRMSAASIAAEVEGLGGQPDSAQIICRTLHQNWSAWLSSQKEDASKDDAQENPQTVWLKTSRLRSWITGTMSCGQDIDQDQDRDQDKRVWFRWCQACVAATRWGVQRQVCLAYTQAWWWECYGLGLHECCWHWVATVHWGNHECQHVLWHTEADHDALPSATGPLGSFSTW